MTDTEPAPQGLETKSVPTHYSGVRAYSETGDTITAPNVVPPHGDQGGPVGKHEQGEATSEDTQDGSTQGSAAPEAESDS